MTGGRLPPLWEAAWLLLALFILYGSSGTWAADGPRVRAPVHVSIPDVVQNVLLFAPFGVFGTLTLRQRRVRMPPIAGGVVIAAGFSLLVEILQLYTVDRTGSVVDILAAVSGAAAGGLAAGRVAAVADRAAASARPSGLFDAPELLPLLVLLGALIFIAWFPFDVTLDVSTMSARLRTVLRDPWQLQEPVALASQALRYALLAILVAACMPRLRTRHAAALGAAVAGAAAMIIDAGQLAMGSQPIGLTGLAAQAAGAVSGAVGVAVSRGTR